MSFGTWGFKSPFAHRNVAHHVVIAARAVRVQILSSGVPGLVGRRLDLPLDERKVNCTRST